MAVARVERHRQGRSKLRALSRICGVGLLLGGTAFVACGGTVTTEHNGTGGSGGGSGGIGSGKCGNGVVDSGELCDGTNLNGKTCSTATAGSRTSGTLRCSSSCTLDISGCTGSGGYGGYGGSGAGYPGVGGSAGMAVGGSTATGGFAGVPGDAGQPPVYNSCSTGDACTLVPNNCCGYCSAQTLDMFTAVNARYAGEYQAAYCGTQVACPPCAIYPEPSYTAVCRGGLCVAVNVSGDSLSSCAMNSDCTLRWGAECCERCFGDTTGTGLTAVRVGSFDSEVCGGFFGCPDCAIPEYPTNARAVCGTDGHCSVQIR